MRRRRAAVMSNADPIEIAIARARVEHAQIEHLLMTAEQVALLRLEWDAAIKRCNTDRGLHLRLACELTLARDRCAQALKDIAL